MGHRRPGGSRVVPFPSPGSGTPVSGRSTTDTNPEDVGVVTKRSCTLESLIFSPSFKLTE